MYKQKGYMMKQRILLPFSMILILAMSGCTQPNMNDSQRTKAEGAGVGILGGALLGALVDGKKGAAWGATLGGLAGYAYGSHVANEKAKYASEEDWLNACIRNARIINKNLKLHNRKLSREIIKTKRLVRLYKQGKIRRATLLKQKRKLDQLRRKSKQMIRMARNELKNQKKILRNARRSSGTKRVQREMRTTSQQLSKLNRQNRKSASTSVSAAV